MHIPERRGLPFAGCTSGAVERENASNNTSPATAFSSVELSCQIMDVFLQGVRVSRVRNWCVSQFIVWCIG